MDVPIDSVIYKNCWPTMISSAKHYRNKLSGEVYVKAVRFLLLGLLPALILQPLHAQSPGSVPVDTKPSTTNPAPAGQAPDDVMKKLSDLVRGGKYAEAQGLTTGLLLAYPDDQRLIKAKCFFFINTLTYYL